MSEIRYYFYILNSEKFGPFTMDELKTKRITNDILVWSDGYENWLPSVEIEELKPFVIPSPPKSPDEKVIEEKKKVKEFNSNNYINQIGKSILTTAIIIIIYKLTFHFLILEGDISNIDEGDYPIYLSYEELQNPFLFYCKIGFYEFLILLPFVYIIKVLISRKKNNSISNENSDDGIENIEIEKIVEYSIKTREGILKIEAKHHVVYDIGDLVTLNDQPCPDGKYKLGFMLYIVVENSKVKQITMV